MTIVFDHRSLRPIDAALIAIRAARLPATGSRALIALIGAFVISASTAGILAMRLQTTRSELSRDMIRLDQTTAAAAPTQSILRKLGEVRTLADEIDRARQSGDGAADELARLGNAVPPHVWIARFRHDGSELIVDGGAASVDAVGRALVSLNTDHARAQLVGLKDGARPGTPSDIRYSLRIDQQ